MRKLKENLLRNIGVGRKKLIDEWLSANKLQIHGDITICKDWTIDVDGDVILRDDMNRFPDYIQFGTVYGDFILEELKSLVGLRGCPKEVGGAFECTRLDSLVSLDGCPKEVDGNFGMYDCKKIESLEGCPKKVGEGFTCCNCTNLKSLKGCPKKIDGDFDCSGCIRIVSLEGCPRNVGGDFICESCTDLISLKGCPKEIGGALDVSDCYNLKSFIGCPQSVVDILFDDCPGISLDGFPKKVFGYIRCTGAPYTRRDFLSICDIGGKVYSKRTK